MLMDPYILSNNMDLLIKGIFKTNFLMERELYISEMVLIMAESFKMAKLKVKAFISSKPALYILDHSEDQYLMEKEYLSTEISLIKSPSHTGSYNIDMKVNLRMVNPTEKEMKNILMGVNIEVNLGMEKRMVKVNIFGVMVLNIKENSNET